MGGLAILSSVYSLIGKEMPSKVFKEGNEPLTEIQFGSTFIRVFMKLSTPFTSWHSKEERKKKEGTKA